MYIVCSVIILLCISQGGVRLGQKDTTSFLLYVFACISLKNWLQHCRYLIALITSHPTMRPDKRHRPSDFQSSYSNRNNRGHNGGGSQGVGGREGNHHSYSHYSSSNRYYRDPNPNHSGRDNYDGTNNSNSQTPFSSNAWGLRGRGGNIDVPTPKDGDNRNNTLQPAIANKFIEEEEKRLSGVNKDTWEQFSHDDRIKSQVRFCYCSSHE